MALRFTSRLLTMSQFSNVRFTMPDDFCNGVFFRRVFVDLGFFEAGAGICASLLKSVV